MNELDECRELVKKLDDFAKKLGFNNFNEFIKNYDFKISATDPKVHDYVTEFIKSIILYRKCKKIIQLG
jgi:hypothetical protein